MNHTTLIVCDLLLALGMTMRVTRFIVTDDLGGWMIRHPIQRWYLAGDKSPKHVTIFYAPDGLDAHAEAEPRLRGKIAALVSCPYCTSAWVGLAALISLWAVGGPSEAWEPWRWFAGWWTLIYVAPHIGARLGDTDGDDNS